MPFNLIDVFLLMHICFIRRYLVILRIPQNAARRINHESRLSRLTFRVSKNSPFYAREVILKCAVRVLKGFQTREISETDYDKCSCAHKHKACDVYNFFPSAKAFPTVSPSATYEWLTGSYVMSCILWTSGWPSSVR